jgi:hypothetical protein
MSREDIIKLAQEAGLIRAGEHYTEPARWGITEITDFYQRAVAAEREACAKVCESYDDRNPGVSNIGYYLGKQIRARGEK